MIRMIAKNERLLGRLDECEKQLREKDMRVNEIFDSVAGKRAGVRVSAAKQAECEGDRERTELCGCGKTER